MDYDSGGIGAVESMNTEHIKITPGQDLSEALHLPAEIIRKGGLVAFPTETVYGLGANAFDPEASARIYAAKGRPSDNPLIVHIAEVSQLSLVTDTVPAKALRLAEAFWPGPLTMILPRKETVPKTTTGGLDTVAVRLPSHPVARALIKESGCLIAAPSANLSGRPSPTTAAHVREDMDGRIDCIVDGGPVSIGLESTIVDLTEDQPMILRPGYITKEALLSVLSGVDYDPNLSAETASGPPKAPGMRYRHYAPKGQMWVVEGPTEAVIAEIISRTAADEAAGLRTGVLATEETADRYPTGHVIPVGARSDEESIARQLFGALREMDAAGVDHIYSESFDTPRMGQAIMNRLLKAAGHQVITL